MATAAGTIVTQIGDRSVILLRTHRFNDLERAFAQRMAVQTGLPVHIVADETHCSIVTDPFGKISFQPGILQSMGLHCPRDAAWRCGDYAFYLARRAMPDVKYFWLVEPDVRFGFASYGDLFKGFEDVSADFIAPFVKRAEREHFWQPTMRWMTPDVFRCFFAFCRMSASAADYCLEQRRRLRWHPAARIMWPNDETFVSTILVRGGFSARDLNDFGRRLVTEDSFGFLNVQRGETLEGAAPDGLVHHPVLSGAEFESKRGRAARGIAKGEAAKLKFLRGLARAHRLLGSEKHA